MSHGSPVDPPLVLIADDEPAVTRLLERALGAAGFRTHVVADGAAALAWLALETPGVVLLDIAMPKVDGRDVLSRVRADPRLGAVPVIMVSGRDDEYTREDVLKLGARELIAKPISAESVVRHVRRALDA